MCIRDRVMAARLAGARRITVTDVLDRPLAQAKQVGADVTPVSYTHLRAHETVLDIVCRLLLEKKQL